MILGDVEETHTSIEVDEETLEESVTVRLSGWHFALVLTNLLDPPSP
jgi:hypothetical protein